MNEYFTDEVLFDLWVIDVMAKYASIEYKRDIALNAPVCVSESSEGNGWYERMRKKEGAP